MSPEVRALALTLKLLPRAALIPPRTRMSMELLALKLRLMPRDAQQIPPRCL